MRLPRIVGVSLTAARRQILSPSLQPVIPNRTTPMAMARLLLPAPPFVSISDVRRLQLPPRGRHRPLLCWRGVGWGSVQTRMVSSFVGSRTRRRNVICASLFGVGAPEALVIGVVALLVFGPKGLAEVARNLGKTLRAFQPTIREIQDVSREFRSTLEREIGIDEVPQSTNYRPTTMNNNQQQPAADPNVKPEPAAYTSEELMKVTQEQIAASAAAAWNPQQPAASQQQEEASTAPSEDAPTSGGSDGPAAPAPAVTVSNSDPKQVNQSEKAEAER